MRISTIFRIAIALVCALVGILTTTFALKFFPDGEEQRLQARATVCENIAVQCCLAAQRGDDAMLQAILEALHNRNPEIVSAGLRRDGQKCRIMVGPHELNWRNENSFAQLAKSEVPIYCGKKLWGRLEICFLEPITTTLGAVSTPVRATVFVAACSFLVFVTYLRRMLQYLDPSAVVPDRVRQALDTLAEGVVIVDPKERIVLANRTFAKHFAKDSDELMGRKLRDLGFHSVLQNAAEQSPWQSSLRNGATQHGVMMHLQASAQAERTFAVNCTPITDAKGASRGALATFDDVTHVERKNKELQDMLHLVKQSREEVRRQNEELTKMATCDALTGCYNRRYLFSHLEKVWSERHSDQTGLACIMLDIDHFKSVNDTHGHAKGDAVLQEVAARLQSAISGSDLLCRYGGEEFCVVMVGQSIDEAAQTAERLRAAIANSPIADLKISSSFGVTAETSGARQPAELLDQADKALYFSKRNGRNRVTRFTDLPADFSVAEKKQKESPAPESDVPFHAVTALLSALLYRDSRTADHSRRVADLAVAIGRKFLSQRDCYILEVAALLHDIGKIGVPDAILLKPGPLTPEEWEVMQIHDRVGTEILNAAFSCTKLNEIVSSHHAWFGGNPRDPDLPTGEQICIEARILSVADAYDAIVSDRVYRKGRSHAEAIVELRRCVGLQFDSRVVETLVQHFANCPDLTRQPVAQVSKTAALQIGLHIERLAVAADACDIKQLSVVADRLGKTATYVGFEPIAEAAKALSESAATEPELNDIVRMTGELLDLCRSTQSAFLQSDAIARRDTALS